MAVEIRGMGRALLWRGHAVFTFMEDELWNKDKETTLLDSWLSSQPYLPPVERIELHDTCVLVVLEAHVVMLMRTPDGLKEKPL